MLEYAVYVQDHSHFNTHFFSPPFEAKDQGIHATDMQRFLFHHTQVETSVLL